MTIGQMLTPFTPLSGLVSLRTTIPMSPATDRSNSVSTPTPTSTPRSFCLLFPLTPLRLLLPCFAIAVSGLFLVCPKFSLFHFCVLVVLDYYPLCVPFWLLQLLSFCILCLCWCSDDILWSTIADNYSSFFCECKYFVGGDFVYFLTFVPIHRNTLLDSTEGPSARLAHPYAFWSQGR